jgi:hypothetical protein
VKCERIPPKTRNEILERIKRGVPAGTAATSCGINRRSFQRWLQLGREEGAREPYRSFADQVDRAFAEWQVKSIRHIDDAGERDWKAAAWQLERLVPSDFGDPSKAGVTINNNLVLVERQETSAWMLDAARRVLDAEAFAALALELSSGEADVIDGEVIETKELEAA